MSNHLHLFLEAQVHVLVKKLNIDRTQNVILFKKEDQGDLGVITMRDVTMLDDFNTNKDALQNVRKRNLRKSRHGIVMSKTFSNGDKQDEGPDSDDESKSKEMFFRNSSLAMANNDGSTSSADELYTSTGWKQLKQARIAFGADSQELLTEKPGSQETPSQKCSASPNTFQEQTTNPLFQKAFDDDTDDPLSPRVVRSSNDEEIIAAGDKKTGTSQKPVRQSSNRQAAYWARSESHAARILHALADVGDRKSMK
eukprot:gene15525-18398_t